MFRRISALTGAVAASLAFAASAHAAPSTPILKPIPTYSCEKIVASWTPSIPDQGGVIVSYRVDIGDLTAGTAGWKWVNGLSTPLAGLVNFHHYVVRVRALEFKGGATYWSGTSARAFMHGPCLEIPKERLNQYVAYNPWPECIMCGKLDDLQIGDPEIYKEMTVATLPGPEKFRGMQIEGDGSVAIG